MEYNELIQVRGALDDAITSEDVNVEALLSAIEIVQGYINELGQVEEANDGDTTEVPSTEDVSDGNEAQSKDAVSF